MCEGDVYTHFDGRINAICHKCLEEKCNLNFLLFFCFAAQIIAATCCACGTIGCVAFYVPHLFNEMHFFIFAQAFAIFSNLFSFVSFGEVFAHFSKMKIQILKIITFEINR